MPYTTVAALPFLLSPSPPTPPPHQPYNILVTGGILAEKLGGGVQPALLKTLTLFMTKMCNFHYPTNMT